MQGRVFLILLIAILGSILGLQSCTQGSAPVANAGLNKTLELNSIITLDGSASQAGSGGKLSYQWRMLYRPLRSRARLDGATTVTPSFRADRYGTYTVELIVGSGRSTSQRDLVVLNVRPNIRPASTNFTHDDNTGDCIQCHNGKDATGKPRQHLASSDLCEACHDMTVWRPVLTIDHLEVRGSCASCHDGAQATGQSPSHIATSSACDTCHSTRNWAVSLTRRGSSSSDDDDDESDDDNDDDGDDDSSGGGFNHDTVTSGCAACHDKESGHIITTNICEACHSPDRWEPLLDLNHDEILGSCSDCHRFPAGHISTTEECNACHRVDAWLPLGGNSSPGSFDHSTLANGASCIACHNGADASGKPPGHVVTSSECSLCHSTDGWIPTLDGGTPSPSPSPTPTPTPTPAFDHSTLAAGASCIACHNGTDASDKPPGHITTSSECDVCHGTSAWIPLLPAQGSTSGSFDHATVAAGVQCQDCHDGITATGKADTHPVTDSSCDVCHSTVRWFISGL